MHYIRFLKPPKLVGNEVRTKITITTDLGESFLWHDLDIRASMAPFNPDQGIEQLFCQDFKWEQGMRSLDIVLNIAQTGKSKEAMRQDRSKKRKQEITIGKNWPMMVIVQAKNLHGLGSVRDAARQDCQIDGTVMDITSAPLSGRQGEETEKRCQRTLRTLYGPANIHVWEEMGESIARHVWDAGIVLAGHLCDLCDSIKPPSPNQNILSAVLKRRHPKILELGAGTGVVGLTFAVKYPESTVLLTDLPEAEELLRDNIKLHLDTRERTKRLLAERTNKAIASNKVSFEVLDWEKEPGEAVRSEVWDLIVVADCTYNVDAIPALVKMLGTVVRGKGRGRKSEGGKQDEKSTGSSADSKAEAGDETRDPVVLVALKKRHESEACFFDLMRDEGFVERETEKWSMEMGVLGGDKEDVEIHLFQMQEGGE